MIVEKVINHKDYKYLSSDKTYDLKRKYLCDKIIQCDINDEHFGDYVTYIIDNKYYVGYETDIEEQTLLDKILQERKKDEQGQDC